MEKVLGGIANMNRTPQAVFIVDISFEDIALAEARKLGLTTFGMVDTNSDPNRVDFPIPANDDASKSIDKVLSYVTASIAEGLADRKADKDTDHPIESKAASPSMSWPSCDQLPPSKAYNRT